MNKKTVDHLGNEYISEAEMCRHYNINKGTYLNRIKIGWSKEDALTKGIRAINHNPIFIDHLGNAFKNQQAMCDHYDIEPDVFLKRISYGWTLEDALTKPTKIDYVATDHLGNEYSSETEMCNHYNINLGTYRGRIKNGWTLEDALTKDTRDINHNPIFIDHLGNAYKDQQAMCDHYGIESDLFSKRISKGWTLEETLTKPVRKYNKNSISTDHLGNKFSSQAEMCKHYGISSALFKYRISKEMSLKDALTKPTNKNE